MNTTEIGVYILGAVALLILAYAGDVAGDMPVMVCAVFSAGAAYLAQLFGALYVREQKMGYATVNMLFLLVALVAWGAGAILLIV